MNEMRALMMERGLAWRELNCWFEVSIQTYLPTSSVFTFWQVLCEAFFLILLLL